MDERIQSSNIQSKVNRGNVESALTKIIQRLKTYGEFPLNGLMIFAGQTDSGLVFEVIESPKPIFTYQYQCGSEFYLQPLEMMLRSNDIIGVISLDTKECGVGLIDGSQCIVIKSITSGVAGKSNQGGSSFRRYERNREANINKFYHRAADLANNILLSYGARIKKLVVSGPAFSKEKFFATDYLDYRLRTLPMQFVDQEYSGNDGILQTAHHLAA